MSIAPIELDIDDSKAQAKLKKVDQESKAVMRAFATNIRRGAEVGLALAEAFGFNIDVVMRLMIETGLRSIEFITTAFAVESIATMGLSTALRLGAQAGAVAMMFAQISSLINARREASDSLGKVVTALRILTFAIIPVNLQGIFMIGVIIGIIEASNFIRRLNK